MTTPQGSRADALAGIRVLDFSIMMAGPKCTRLLADVGAEIIKIEPPDGDHMRSRPPLRQGRSTYFGQLNCGKRSIVLDLKRREAIEIIRKLVRQADIVVENFRPGVMRRLGLDYASLADINPRLIYCSISGFGQSGPGAGRPAYAPVIHAASGYDRAQLSYQDGQERPAKSGIFIADILGGIYAFSAIETALFQRERTGLGQFIDVSLMDGMFDMLVYEFQEAQFPSDRRRHLYLPLRAEGGYVIVAPVSQNNFENLCDAIGRPEWKIDRRFATVGAREQHWDELMGLVEQWTMERPAEECEVTLMTAGIPCSRYLTLRDAMTDPHYAARGSFAGIDDGSGPFLVPNPPFQMTRARAAARAGVPLAGEHSRAVLQELLGLAPEAVDSLVAEGVVSEGGAAGPLAARARRP
ncbi:MAG: CaiB/BaiF CoA transferase family protein [Stellaceae bacterium]